jgi:two-component system OmpR family sensor kinase
MMRHRWFWPVSIAIVLIPTVCGIVAAALLNRSLDIVPRAYASAPVTTVVWLVGVLLTLLLAVALTFYTWIRWREETLGTKITTKIAEQTAEERRRFLRRLDHELKNPLTAIRAGLANLAEAPVDARRETLNSVETQTQRISRLVTDLRKLAEMETRPLERSPVDVTALLEEAVNVAKDTPETADRHITLTVPQAPWPLPHVAGDWDLLFLAVYNLLDNAHKFTRPGDTMEVRAFEDGTMVVVEVADTGPGIPEEDIPHVWEELYRGKGAHGIPGSGLGLALVRAIVERHGGSASVRSRAGQGTVFTLRFSVK